MIIPPRIHSCEVLKPILRLIPDSLRRRWPEPNYWLNNLDGSQWRLIKHLGVTSSLCVIWPRSTVTAISWKPPPPLSILPFRPMISLPLSAALLIFFCFHFFFFKKTSFKGFLFGRRVYGNSTQYKWVTNASLPPSLSLLSFVVCVRLSTRLSPSGNIQTVTRSQMEPWIQTGGRKNVKVHC